MPSTPAQQKLIQGILSGAMKLAAAMALALAILLTYEIVSRELLSQNLASSNAARPLGFVFALVLVVLEIARLNYFVWENLQEKNRTRRLATGRTGTSIGLAALAGTGGVVLVGFGLSAYAATSLSLNASPFLALLAWTAFFYCLVVFLDALLWLLATPTAGEPLAWERWAPLAARLEKTLGPLVEWKHFAAVHLFALGTVYVLLGVGHGLFTHTIFGDESLDVYSAQTIANGFAPFEKYIIFHPPLAYLPVSAAIWLGRTVGLDDIISARLAKLAFVLISMLLVYLISKEISRSRVMALGGALLLGWSILFTMISSRSPTKLVFMLFLLALIWALQQKKFFWAGVTTVALALSWGGGFVYLPIPAVILLFHRSRKVWLEYFSGLLVSAIALAVYLYLGGALDLFGRQYLSGLAGIIQGVNPFSQSTQVDFSPSTNASLIEKLSPLSGSDRWLLISGLVALGGYVILPLTRAHGVRQLWRGLGDPTRAPILLALILTIGVSVVDFQSVVDIVPAIGPLSLAVILVLDQIARTRDGRLARSKAFMYLLFVGMSVVLTVSRVAEITPPTASYQSQQVAYEWVSRISPGFSIQSFGNLGLQVVSNQENASRVIHLGPKTLIAIRAEGIDLARFFNEQSADFIVLDRRNAIKPEAEQLADSLNGRYLSINGAGVGGEYRTLFFERNNESGLAAAYGILLSATYPLVVQADLALLEGDTARAAELYAELGDLFPDLGAFAQLQLAAIRLAAGDRAAAEALYQMAGGEKAKWLWGPLGAGNYYYSIGDSARAQDYYDEILTDGIPAAFAYRLPDLFTPRNLLGRTATESIPSLDEISLVSYDFEILATGDGLLTVWWYNFSPQNSNRVAWVSIQGLDAEGRPVGAPREYATVFARDIGVRWSYLLDAGQILGADRLRIVLKFPERNPSPAIELEFK